jgi:transcriptional regulator with XRE-family HTH domain
MIKEKLLEARLKKGLSQEELADLMNMTQSNYSRRENGLKSISEAEWQKFSSILNVEKEDIYEEDSPSVVYKNIKGHSFNSGNIHYFNIPDFVLEHIDLLKSQIQTLLNENQSLKDKLK